MSTFVAPELELPRAATQQVVIGEPSPVQTATVSDLIPNSITIPAWGHSQSKDHEPIFGTHIREAVAIFKDWFAE